MASAKVGNASEPIRVLWVPTPSAEGSVSMWRYWNALSDAHENRSPTNDFVISHAIPRTSRPPLRRGVIVRALRKYVVAPLHVACLTRQNFYPVVHVLDHSWAHVLPFVNRRCRIVVTLHDLIPLIFPGELTTGQLRRFARGVDCIKRADAVVAVSHYTARQACDLLHLDPAKVKVIWNGADPPRAFAPEDVTIQKLLRWQSKGSGLVLGSIGSALERKNLRILVPALKVVLEAGHSVRLLRAGGEIPSGLRVQLNDLLGDNFYETGLVDDSALEAFYAVSDVLIVPSFYEGFGLPVVEAMARRKAVVCSNTSSLPEVGEDAVIYFDPQDPKELAGAILRLLNPAFRAQCGDRAGQRAAKFSWTANICAHYDLYQSLIKRARPLTS